MICRLNNRITNADDIRQNTTARTKSREVITFLTILADILSGHQTMFESLLCSHSFSFRLIKRKNRYTTSVVTVVNMISGIMMETR